MGLGFISKSKKRNKKKNNNKKKNFPVPPPSKKRIPMTYALMRMTISLRRMVSL
jgi:hypothetical protein